VQDDINSLIEYSNKTATEKSILISTRMGQGKFRSGLVDYWQGCAITGYSGYRFLVASHIKPWRASNDTERLDPFNGLLLLLNLDKAFDLGYITFKTQGKIVISSTLEQPDKLGLNALMQVRLESRHQVNLAYHREVILT